MKHYLLLLKKQMLDAIPTRTRRKRLPDMTSPILMLVLIGVIIAVFALIFSRFIDTYTAIKINRVPDVSARQYEIMSIGYFVLIVMFVFSGVSALSNTLFENSDLNILITMPFSSMSIFLSKLTWVYLKQVVVALLCVPTLNFTFFLTTNTLTAYNGVMTFIVAIVLPVIPLGIASIVVLPYYYFKCLTKQHYIFVFLIMTGLMALFCWGYSFVFRFAQNLISSGKLTSLFNEKTMNFILAFTKFNYPANIFASIMLGRDIGKNIGILLAIMAGASLIGTLIVHAIFIKVSHSQLAFHIPHTHKRKVRLSKNTRFGNLFVKEFLLVMRTPSYAYMYFTTAAVMPVMAYYSANIASSMLSGLLGQSDISFEVCTFIVILYSTLTNTFCSTNISRDGYMSMMQKTLPYSPSKILSAKIVFCAVVAELSIVIACLVLGLTGLEKPVDVVVTFIGASLFAFAQIVFSTKRDLSHPHFARTEDGEIKESNSTVSSIIALGLASSFIIGGGLLATSLSSLLQGGATVEVNKAVSYSIALCVPLALLALSLVYFFHKLSRTYANLDTEA